MIEALLQTSAVTARILTASYMPHEEQASATAEIMNVASDNAQSFVCYAWCNTSTGLLFRGRGITFSGVTLWAFASLSLCLPHPDGFLLPLPAAASPHSIKALPQVHTPPISHGLGYAIWPSTTLNI